VKHVPHWLPGAGFKRTALNWEGTLSALTERPYEFVRHQMKSGQYRPSFLSQLLEQSEGDLTPEEINVAKCSAMSLFTAGADTVSDEQIP
jgi:hypothetical protein